MRGGKKRELPKICLIMDPTGFARDHWQLHQHFRAGRFKNSLKDSGLSLSPATIRNIMSDLSDQGYLTQVHTSGGRIPTDKAYRFFVDSLGRRQTSGTVTEEHWRDFLSGSECGTGSVDQHFPSVGRINQVCQWLRLPKLLWADSSILNSSRSAETGSS